MASITEVRKYTFEKKEYTTLQQIKTVVENKLGIFIDTLDVTLTPKQKLNILQGLIAYKTAVVYALSITYLQETDDENCLYNTLEKNILDL